MTADDSGFDELLRSFSPRGHRHRIGADPLDLANRPTIWVLGAGASRNYQPGIPIPSQYEGMKPPLQTDFFLMVEHLIRMVMKTVHMTPEDPLSLLLFKLGELYASSHWQASDEFYGLDTRPEKFLARDRANLEELFTALDLYFTSKWASVGHVFKADEGYFQLPEAVGSVSLEPRDRERFVNLLTATLVASMGHEPCQYHQRLAATMKQGDTVITFNYDTLIDEALFDAGKSDLDSYCLPFSAVVVQKKNEKGVVEYDYLHPRFVSSPVRLLKLHGSLNWIRCAQCDSAFFDAGSGSGSLMKALRGHMEGTLKSMSSGYSRDWSLFVDPLADESCPFCSRLLRRAVIPPTANKQFSESMFFRPWRAAVTALARDSNLVLIGYSLPLTDHYSRLLFTLARPASVLIVNPDNSIGEHFQRAFRMLQAPTVISPEEFSQRFFGSAQARPE